MVPSESEDRDPVSVTTATGEEGPLVFGGRLLRPGDRVGAWVYEREVGSGGMAQVLLARDPSGVPVALKVLRQSRLQTGLARFRREFHALSRLDHPNVVKVYAYGDLHGHPYIAMEYVDGPDLHRVIRGFSQVDDATRWRRVEELLIHLCRALSAIHRRGLVHRDLKPSNILLTSEGVPKLTDFGIVKDLDPQRDAEVSTTLVGTWAYTSPEHISGEPVDHRSDLYSLGVILFAMLTGKRPFVADGMAGYLEAHRDHPVPVPSRLRPGVPPHLETICLRLLSKAPRERFQSAQEILHRLEADDLAPGEGSGWVAPLVGRDPVIAALDDAVAGLTGGRGGVLELVADDGMGKTRVLELAADRARSLGLPLHALAFRRDEAAFTQALHLARELLRDLPASEAEELRRVVRAWDDGCALRGDTRYALYEGVRAALTLALADAPRVLLLDDVHEARPPEADLFRYLGRSLIGAGLRLLVVTAGRPSAEPAADRWGAATPTQRLALGPLSAEHVQAMVASLIGPGRAASVLAGRLQAETEGNPWFVAEFLRSLEAGGLIATRSDGARSLAVDPHDLADGHLEIPPGIRQLLRRRLDALRPEDREALEALAVGGATDLDLLLDVLEAGESDLLGRLDRLVDAGLVRERRHTDLVTHEVVHRQLVELLRGDLVPDRARGLHRAFAAALAEHDALEAEVLERIGQHCRLAGEAGQAFAHLVAAADRLVERSMPEEAARLVEHAAAVELAARGELPESRWLALRTDLLRARAAVLGNRGAWSEAAAILRELVAHADDLGDERAACAARSSLCRVLRRLGEHEQALTAAQEALATARRHHFRKGVAEALLALSGLAWAEGDLDGCEAHADEGLVRCDGPSLAPQRAQLLMSRAAAQAHRGQLASAVRGMGEAEELFRELRMKPLRVLALSNLSELHLWQGESDEAFTRADEAADIAEGLRYALGIVAGLRARGMAATALGRYDDAHHDLQRALDLARDIGLRDEVLACSVALTGLALEQSDPFGACRHGAVGLSSHQGPDPERYLPLLQALLARALARSRSQTAFTLLQAVDDALPTLSTPRRLQVLLGAAAGWLALGNKARATEHAQDIIREPASRAFRLLCLEARALLATTTTGEEARRHRRIGAELAREFTGSLPVHTSEEVRRRPVFRYFAGA